MRVVLTRVSGFLREYPLAKGMLAYSIMWPTGCVIQQTIAGKRWDTYDWTKCVRFSLYGTLFVAPTLYGWVRLTTYVWPVSNLRTAVYKSVCEQLSYGPAATASFFFLMSLMEYKTIEEAKQEVRDKFWPTFKIGCCYWLTVQTFNYSIIPVRNRVPFVSLFGLLWTTFLAYMKQRSSIDGTVSLEAIEKIKN